MDWQHVGYRMRWAYVVVVAALWLMWYALFIEPMIFRWLRWWQGGPVDRVLDLVYVFWANSNSGPDIWWGLRLVFTHRDIWMFGMSMPTSMFHRLVLLGCSLVMPLGLIGAIVAYTRTSEAGIRQLPALVRPSWSATLAAALMASLLLVCLLYFGAMADVFDSLSASPYQPASVLDLMAASGSGSAFPAAAIQGAAVVLLLVSWGPMATGLQVGWSRLPQYWRLERVTRWVALAAIVCFGLQFAIVATGSDRDPVMATGTFASLTVLIWAVTCRVVLLFRLQRFYAAQKEATPFCVACGYDLRGSTIAAGARCPECGAAVDPKLVRIHSEGGFEDQGVPR